MTMTIQPFQSLILNALYDIFLDGGYGETDLYVEQLTPLVILSDTADDTDQTIEEVQEDVDDSMLDNETTDEDLEEIRMNPSQVFSDKENYEVI
jgi:hypothetical protein